MIRMLCVRLEDDNKKIKNKAARRSGFARWGKQGFKFHWKGGGQSNPKVFFLAKGQPIVMQTRSLALQAA